MLKYVVRRGKELVKQAFIATGNEENEYGKATVPRQAPFRSSSSDVLQSTLRCNADYQYQKRAVPDLEMKAEAEYQYQMRAEAEYQRKMTAEADSQYQKTSTAQQPSATEQRQSEVVQNFTASFLYGCGVLKTSTGNQCQQLLIMTTLATAMRAANVADFYMTKYLSKAQEALGPVIQPFIAGMRRIAGAENAPEAAESTLVQRARQRIRRFIFSANRTMWFSACELGVLLATSSSCVKTEENRKVFSGKGIAMMHECKRLLNHRTAAEGLLLARTSAQRTKVGCPLVGAFCRISIYIVSEC